MSMTQHKFGLASWINKFDLRATWILFGNYLAQIGPGNICICIMTKTRHFRVRLAGFMNMNFFVRDQIANSNAKTPRFRHNVNKPCRNLTFLL